METRHEWSVAQTASIQVHPSCFPAAQRADLGSSLRQRQVAPKFLYESFRQSQKWLALFDAYSPYQRAPACRKIYDNLSAAVPAFLPAGRPVHLVSLGCGSGEKEAGLLQILSRQGRRVIYSPCDVSLALVLAARETARDRAPLCGCQPWIVDITSSPNLSFLLGQSALAVTRVVTFFGIAPNLEPRQILEILRPLLGPGDLLLFSANLSPGRDYARGTSAVLPLYDNEPTRDWLLTFLADLGLDRGVGELKFAIERVPRHPLLRIVATFHFRKRVALSIFQKKFRFAPGETMRLFYSCRYTLPKVRQLLKSGPFVPLEERVTPGKEEAVFLCQASRGVDGE